MNISKEHLGIGVILFLLVMRMAYSFTAPSHPAAAAADNNILSTAYSYQRTYADKAAEEETQKAERDADETVDSDTGAPLSPQKRCQKRMEIFAKKFSIDTDDYAARHPDAISQCLLELKQPAAATTK